MTHHEDRAAKTVSAAGSEESQDHSEDHDGKTKDKTSNATLPGMGELIIIIVLELLDQDVGVGDALTLKDLKQRTIIDNV